MTFQSPRKCILSPDQLTAFQSSKTHQEVVAYIETLNSSIIGVKLTDDCAESPVCATPQVLYYAFVLINSQGVKVVLGMLDKVEEIANSTPAVENSASRFGNPAFRTFYDKVSEVCLFYPRSRWLRLMINVSPHHYYMALYLTYRRVLFQRSLSTSSRRGAIDRG
jgi:hypothetical protein